VYAGKFELGFVMKKNICRFIIAAVSVFLFLVSVPGCSPSTPEDCLRQGVIRLKEGKVSAARKLAVRAEKLAPENHSVLIFKALVCEQAGEYDLALDAAGKAVKLNPKSFTAHYTLGRLYSLDPGRSADALRELQYAYRLNPGDQDTLVLLSNITVAVNAGYAKIYLDLLQKDAAFTDKAAIHNQRGIFYCRQRKFASAKKEFEAASKLDSSNPLYLLNLARFFDFFTTGSSVAESFYRQFIQACGNDPEFTADCEAVKARLEYLSASAGR
jgi:tetratricopeptide (TPR) repeat protein